MKIVITGGHISPALSVLEILPMEDKVLFIGRKHALEGDKAISLENKIALEKNIPFKAITTGRFQRKLTKHTFFSVFKTPVGFFQSLKILKEFKADALICFGGYVSFPVALAAFALRIPIVIHEQTLEAGLANKIISKFANKICISWESSRKYFPKEKVILTGNPIRKFQITNNQYPITNDVPVLYITGGSLGSHAINLLVEGCIEKLLKDFVVIHQTGNARKFKDFERLEEFKKTLKKNLKERYVLFKFINPQDVGSLLNEASLVVSRSGINTVTELIYFSKPAILIPLSHGQWGEQKKNAEFFKELGLGEVLNQNNLSSEELYETIKSMKNNLKKYKNETKNIVDKDAGLKIAEVVHSFK